LAAPLEVAKIKGLLAGLAGAWRLFEKFRYPRSIRLRISIGQFDTSLVKKGQAPILPALFGAD
jgi:hypothetical protein